MEQADLLKQYTDAVSKRIEAAQRDGTVSSSFMYSFGGHEWVLVLPHSVMEQKRLVHLRSEYAMTGSFEAEKEFLEAIIPLCKCDSHNMNVNDFSLGELEVLKMAYSDGLIAPLFQGGDRAVTMFMEETLKRLKK